MLKHVVIEDPESCLNKALAQEELFVLLARDPAAPVAIRAWIDERIRLGRNPPGDEQIREAYECATRMELQRGEIESSRGQQCLPLAVGPVETGAVGQEERLSDDDPLVDVLHRILGNRTGRLRVSDAYLICGIEPARVNQGQIYRLGRAIRSLGWERMRCFFDGSFQAAYVRGTAEEPQVQITVEYDAHKRSCRIEGGVVP